MTEPLPVGAALIRTATTVGEQVQAARADSGLSALQLQALRVCLDGPTMSGLAARLRLTKSTATSLIDQLAASGLVYRHPDPDDGRRQLVSPTAPGAEALRRFDAAVQRNVAHLFEAVPGDRRARLVELLARIPEAGRPIPLA